MTKKQFIGAFFRSLLIQSISVFTLLVLWRIVEFHTVAEAIIPDETPKTTFWFAILEGEAAATGLYLISLGWIIALIGTFSRIAAKILYSLMISILLVIFLGATQFFYTAQLLLDKVVFYFRWDELELIIHTETGTSLSQYSELYTWCIIILVVFIVLGFLTKRKSPVILRIFRMVAAMIIGFLIVSFYSWPVNNLTHASSKMALSKTGYFEQSVLGVLIPKSRRDMSFDDMVTEYRRFNDLDQSVLQKRYPLIHKFNPEVGNISKYFNSFEGSPNVVLVFCEGLSSCFSGSDAFYGSATPNLDSLYAQGLYWPNGLSNTDRTHGIFANILASMPHGFERGMTNLRSKPYPQHFSVPKYLIGNGYDAAFLYGGWAYFDNYEPYLRKNYVDKIYDKKFFEKNYNVLGFHHNNDFSWGVADIPFFNTYFKFKPEDQLRQPYLGIFLNQSLHSPFKIPDQEKFIAQARKNFLKVNDDIDLFNRNKDKFSTICYMDQALGNFIRQYRTRSDFENTIFILMGDHNFCGFPLINDLDQHHVPLLIYSQKLKETHTFKDIVAQTDLPATIVKLVQPYLPDAKIPEFSNWMSSGLSTTNEVKATKPIFIGSYTGEIKGVVRGNKVFINNRLFQITGNMELERIHDNDTSESFENAISDYQVINEYVIKNDKLLLDRDSLYLNHRGDFYFGKESSSNSDH